MQNLSPTGQAVLKLLQARFSSDDDVPFSLLYICALGIDYYIPHTAAYAVAKAKQEESEYEDLKSLLFFLYGRSTSPTSNLTKIIKELYLLLHNCYSYDFIETRLYEQLLRPLKPAKELWIIRDSLLLKKLFNEENGETLPDEMVVRASVNRYLAGRHKEEDPETFSEAIMQGWVWDCQSTEDEYNYQPDNPGQYWASVHAGTTDVLYSLTAPKFYTRFFASTSDVKDHNVPEEVEVDKLAHLSHKVVMLKQKSTDVKVRLQKVKKTLLTFQTELENV
jgi:hypothetical protein